MPSGVFWEKPRVVVDDDPACEVDRRDLLDRARFAHLKRGKHLPQLRGRALLERGDDSEFRNLADGFADRVGWHGLPRLPQRFCASDRTRRAALSPSGGRPTRGYNVLSQAAPAQLGIALR
jgi:hypothetical protein